MQISLGKIFFILIFSTFSLYGYSVSMSIDNSTPMIGEKCTLVLEFNYDNLEEYEIEEAEFEDFEVTLLKERESQDKNGTWQVQQRYEIVPHKAGNFSLHSLKTHIEMIEEQYQ